MLDFLKEIIRIITQSWAPIGERGGGNAFLGKNNICWHAANILITSLVPINAISRLRNLV